ncbi:hypothetical protein M413DRAFT_132762 [Hebeloma cylindrosporum]|uniref:Uncharacterized protein n=1 Tax=Hebeloma cylindrosporum TaxID=76867 RepID=A0A0C2YMW9_HEBCY|nr:hypothetical protein M413DRAFT_132762 [Hebeloma cylindrosporum h7]
MQLASISFLISTNPCSSMHKVERRSPPFLYPWDIQMSESPLPMLVANNGETSLPPRSFSDKYTIGSPDKCPTSSGVGCAAALASHSRAVPAGSQRATAHLLELPTLPNVHLQTSRTNADHDGNIAWEVGVGDENGYRVPLV